jgi:hypothetical protein
MENKKQITNEQIMELHNVVVSKEGSLGLLALGSLGLKIWRQKIAESTKKNAPAKNKS